MRLSTLVLILLPMSAFAADPETRVIRVLDPDGKPATGAKVWVHDLGEVARFATPLKKVEPPPALSVDADGTVRLPIKPSDAKGQSRLLFARDEQGRIGSLPLDSGSRRTQEPTLKLMALSKRKGRVLDTDGKPVSGVTVILTGMFAGMVPGRDYEPPIYIPQSDRSRYAVKTDADGRFEIATIPDSITNYVIDRPDVIDILWTSPPKIELVAKLPQMCELTLQATGIDPKQIQNQKLTLSIERDRAILDPAETKTRFMIRKTLSFDSDGKAIVNVISGMRYDIALEGSGLTTHALVKNDPIALTSDRVQQIALPFALTALMTGSVVAADTGKGIAGARVFVQSVDPMSQRANTLFAETDKDGNYSVHGPEGNYTAFLADTPEGFIQNRFSPQPGSTASVKVAAGEKKGIPAIKLQRAVSLTGRVLRDGKPVKDAQISLPSSGIARNSVRSDEKGEFTLKNLMPGDSITLRVRAGGAVNLPETLELKSVKELVTIDIAEANATTLVGRVLDRDGKTIPKANVRLEHMVWGVGQNFRMGIATWPEYVTTDAEGRYRFPAYWSVDRYRVKVEATGFVSAECDWVTGVTGKTVTIPDFKLGRTDLSIAGLVRDVDGKPVADAVIVSPDAAKLVSTTSTADGTFTLKGLNSGPVFVIARKTGYYATSAPVISGQKESVALTLTPVNAPPAARLTHSPEYLAARQKLTRHLLEQMWESRAKTRYGLSAILRMARIDPEQAKQWAEAEKKATDGKTDYTSRIGNREDTLLATAKTDLDEAISQLSTTNATAFYECLQVGKALLATDKNKALRFAEEAVIRARQVEPGSRMLNLMQAGDLAVKAGGKQGHAVMSEAAKLASELPISPNSRPSYNVGMSAAILAPHDGPTSAALLNRLADAGDYNRFVAYAAGYVASTDLPRAKEMLKRFRTGRTFYSTEASIRVARAIANTQPEEAMKLVEANTTGPHRVLGLMQLARKWAPQNRERAFRAIDAAFLYMEENPTEFTSSSGMGGACGVAFPAIIRANEIGYPNPASLVARSLALQQTRDVFGGINDTMRNKVIFAAVLALVDVRSASHLLSQAISIEQVIQQGHPQSRDQLFAIALVDPIRGMKLVDQVLDLLQGKTPSKNASSTSQLGILELSSILTANDKLSDLMMWVHLIREIDDRD